MSIEVRVENAPRFAHVPKEVLTADVSTGARCLWSLLATYAWHDGRSWSVGVDTLAEELRASDRSIHKWTAELEAADMLRVERRREKQQPNVYTIVYPKQVANDLRLPNDVQEAPQILREGGEESSPVEQGGEQRSDEGSKQRARELAKNEIPADFPDELRPHARSVMRVLRDMAEHHGAKEVTARAVALVVMANRRKALVAEAYAMASWADGRSDIRDVVGRYRTWLKRADTMAGVERLDERGLPCAPGPRGVVGGGQGRAGGRMSALDQALANADEIRALRAAGEIE